MTKPNLWDLATLPTSFKIRPRAIERIKKGKPLTRSMGARIYKKYINSPEWKEKVNKFRKSYCEICGFENYLNLHHTSYKKLLLENDDDFITLCRYCHLSCHVGLLGTGWLKEPSRAGWKIANRMRNGLNLKRDATATFLRRRYSVRHGAENLPEFNYFRNYYLDNIKNRQFPFNMAIAKL